MRIARLLGIVLTLVALASLGAPAPGQAAPARSDAHVALVDLGNLFGDDEDEPDENEPDEGTAGRTSAAAADPESDTSFGHVLLSLGLGIVAACFVGRWFFRARAWVRQLARGRAA